MNSNEEQSLLKSQFESVLATEGICPVVVENSASVSINTRLLELQPAKNWDEVKEVRGLVKLKRDGVFFPARVGDRIDGGDMVKVENQSSVVIGDRKGSFRCGENSIIHFPARPGNGRPGEIEIQSGKIIFQAPAGGDFKVKKPVRAVIMG